MAPTEPPSSAFIGIIIGLVSSFGSIVLIALVIFIFWASGCAGSGRIILDRLGRPGEYDDEQAFAREEAEALETMDDMTRTEYLRAKGITRKHDHRASLSMTIWHDALIDVGGDADNLASLCYCEPPRVVTYRHLAVTIPCDTRKGRVSMGV